MYYGQGHILHVSKRKRISAADHRGPEWSRGCTARQSERLDTKFTMWDQLRQVGLAAVLQQ